VQQPFFARHNVTSGVSGGGGQPQVQQLKTSLIKATEISSSAEIHSKKLVGKAP
jgi:hypothetical protein